MKIPYPMITIFWRDIVGDSGWSAPEELGKTADCVTRGWLISEDEHNYYVASTVGFTDGEKIEVCDRNTIPRGCVKSIKFDGRRGKTVTKREKQLLDSGRTVKENLMVQDSAGTMCAVRKGGGESPVEPPPVKSKRGCKTAAPSSNTDAGHPANRENVGANPAGAATPQVHVKDKVIAKEVIQ